MFMKIHPHFNFIKSRMFFFIFKKILSFQDCIFFESKWFDSRLWQSFFEIFQVEFENDLMKGKRETLTQMLMALMEQKEARHTELKARLNELEKHKSEETDNYWLIQYQKLLDSKPKVSSLLSHIAQGYYFRVWIFKKSSSWYNFLIQLKHVEVQIRTKI